ATAERERTAQAWNRDRPSRLRGKHDSGMRRCIRELKPVVAPDLSKRTPPSQAPAKPTPGSNRVVQCEAPSLWRIGRYPPDSRPATAGCASPFDSSNPAVDLPATRYFPI